MLQQQLISLRKTFWLDRMYVETSVSYYENISLFMGMQWFFYFLSGIWISLAKCSLPITAAACTCAVFQKIINNCILFPQNIAMKKTNGQKVVTET